MNKITTFKKGRPSPRLTTFLKKIRAHGYEFLTEIIVDTKSKNVYLFCESLMVKLPCEIGINGFVECDDSKEGDKKTPLCDTRVRHIDMPIEDINNPDAAAITKTIRPAINLGPCFICLYTPEPYVKPTGPYNDDDYRFATGLKVRGIGFHGCHDDSDGVLRPTDGCIRMFNADLLLIRKLFYKNLQIRIK